jgi:hypothetical protein
VKNGDSRGLRGAQSESSKVGLLYVANIVKLAPLTSVPRLVKFPYSPFLSMEGSQNIKQNGDFHIAIWDSSIMCVLRA